MKRAILIVALTSMGFGAEVPDGGRPLTPPAPVRTFGMESRPVWDRPMSIGVSGNGSALQKQTEAALDRGNDTIQDRTIFELNVLELKNAGATEKQLYEAQQYRADQIEKQRLQQSRHTMREKRYETEAQSLAKERAAWAVGGVVTSGQSAAVVDRDALSAVESGYQSALATATSRRDAALASAGNDRAAREVAVKTFENEKASAIQQRTEQRDVIFGTRK